MYKEELINLKVKRSELEDNIQNTIVQLQPYKEKGYDGQLTDSEGFPKPNLDFGELSIYRNLKRKLNELNNDHIALMKQIEQTMINFHAQLKSDPQVLKELEEYDKHVVVRVPEPIEQQQAQVQEQVEDQKQQVQPEPPIQQVNTIQPFAVITEVSSNSPAFHAGTIKNNNSKGFKTNDMIVQFGTIDAVNHNNLANLSEFVRDNINTPIKVFILREEDNDAFFSILYNGQWFQKKDLWLTPQAWEGAGSLGCRFKVIQ